MASLQARMGWARKGARIPLRALLSKLWFDLRDTRHEAGDISHTHHMKMAMQLEKLTGVQATIAGAGHVPGASSSNSGSTTTTSSKAVEPPGVEAAGASSSSSIKDDGPAVSLQQQLRMPNDLWDLLMSHPCQGVPKVMQLQLLQAIQGIAASADWSKPEHRVLVWWSTGLLMSWAWGWKEVLVWRGVPLRALMDVAGSAVPDVQLSMAGGWSDLIGVWSSIAHYYYIS